MARKKKTDTAVAVVADEAQTARMAEHFESLAQQDAAAKIATEAELPKLTVTARCEQAKEISCSCRCRGKYHAKPHPDGWKLEPGCEPLTPEERKVAKRESLNVWRRAHPERVSAYMKQWRETSDSFTAQTMRANRAKTAEKAAAAEPAVEESVEE